MTIAITVDPEIPVPPKYYGGIERMVDLLVHGLVERGHEVVLFADRESRVPCKLEPYPASGSRGASNIVRNTLHVWKGIVRCAPRVVHSFGRLAYLLPILPSRIPKIMSYQRAITSRSVEAGERLGRGTLRFTGCSANLISAFQDRPNWHVVYNGVSAAYYQPSFDVAPDAPLVFLGRVEEIKGPHVAIEVAKATGRRLIIAGNVPPEELHQSFFRRLIEPQVDGRLIEYVGPVTDADKNQLLRSAAALLMPILWDEPFGIVMAEALACGTPVLGFGRGSVPEVIQDGVNGFVCESAEAMIAAVPKLPALNRRRCRSIFEEKFSDTAMVDGYERLYEQAVIGR